MNQNKTEQGGEATPSYKRQSSDSLKKQWFSDAPEKQKAAVEIIHRITRERTGSAYSNELIIQAMEEYAAAELLKQKDAELTALREENDRLNKMNHPDYKWYAEDLIKDLRSENASLKAQLSEAFTESDLYDFGVRILKNSGQELANQHSFLSANVIGFKDLKAKKEGRV